MVREALGVADLPDEVGEAIYAKTKGQPALPRGGHPLAAGARRAGAHPRRLVGHARGRAGGPRDPRPGPGPADVAHRPAAAGHPGGAQGGVGRRPLVRCGRCWAASTTPLLRPVVAGARLRRADRRGAGRPRRRRRRRRSRFRHALVQDVAYESLPFARRRDLHGRVARYLEATQASPDHAPARPSLPARGRRGEDAAARGPRVGVVGRGVREPRGDRLPRPRARDGPRARRRATPACAAGSRN